MISALIQGELVSEPQARTASNGKPFWTVSVRVPTGTDVMFVGLTTFSETAGERLMRLHKGSAVAAAGTLEPSSWTGRDGEERRGWRLTASEVLSVYQARKRRDDAPRDADGESDSRSVPRMWREERERDAKEAQ
jgi:single-stranded DNA-binding protein